MIVYYKFKSGLYSSFDRAVVDFVGYLFDMVLKPEHTQHERYKVFYGACLAKANSTEIYNLGLNLLKQLGINSDSLKIKIVNNENVDYMIYSEDLYYEPDEETYINAYKNYKQQLG